MGHGGDQRRHQRHPAGRLRIRHVIRRRRGGRPVWLAGLPGFSWPGRAIVSADRRDRGLSLALGTAIERTGCDAAVGPAVPAVSRLFTGCAGGSLYGLGRRFDGLLPGAGRSRGVQDVRCENGGAPCLMRGHIFAPWRRKNLRAEALRVWTSPGNRRHRGWRRARRPYRRSPVRPLGWVRRSAACRS